MTPGQLLFLSEHCCLNDVLDRVWEDVVGTGSKRIEFGSMGKKRERTQRNKDKHIKRDSMKHRKAKVQRERPKSEDRCREGQKFREKPKDRNSERCKETETHREITESMLFST